MIHLAIDVVLVILIGVAYIVGLNRNRAAGKAEVQEAKDKILEAINRKGK